MPDLREDFRAFCSAIGVELWPHQIEAANSDAFVTVIAKARQTGGSMFLQCLAIYTAFRDAGVSVVIVSATQESSRGMTEAIGARLAGNALTKGSVVDEQSMRVRLANGSEIVSLPASERQIRGRTARLVLLDEASYLHPRIWQAAEYVALAQRAQGSRIVMCSTPWSVGFFRDSYEAGLDGDPDFESFHWDYKVSGPNLDAAYLERQRERVSPSQFQAEVLGRFSDAAGSLFSRSLLEAQTADFEVPQMHELRPPAAGMVGVDYGVSHDRSSLAAIYRVPDLGLNPDAERLPRFVLFSYGWPQATPLSTTVDDVAAIPARSHCIATETNACGAMPSQELGRILRERGNMPRHLSFTATTNARKVSGFGALLALLERGQLFIPRDPTLLSEFAGLQFRQGEQGFTTYGNDSTIAQHDDRVDAAQLACGTFTQKNTNRVSSLLLHLASREAVADVELHPLNCAVVESGAGHRLYERPAIQSVADQNFTLPLGVSSVAPPPPEDRVGRFVIKPTRKAT